jgi:hypothetical protein
MANESAKWFSFSEMVAFASGRSDGPDLVSNSPPNVQTEEM